MPPNRKQTIKPGAGLPASRHFVDIQRMKELKTNLWCEETYTIHQTAVGESQEKVSITFFPLMCPFLFGGSYL